jgi:selenocysteine lyase/cysteine desulfurase
MSFHPDGARFEAGNPSLIGCFVLDNALERLERLDPDAVLAHALDLGGAIREGLVARGIAPLTPAARDERAGNVCFPSDSARDLADALAKRHVLVWGGDGRVRVSAHCHNDGGDVGRFLAALDAVA